MEIVTADFLLAMLRCATPLIFAALGVLLAERAGVIHVSVEGTMLAGALAGVLGVAYWGNVWMGVLLSIIVGIVTGLILAGMYVYLPGEQIIMGFMFNFVTIGITSVIYRLTVGKTAAMLTITPPTFFNVSSFTLVAFILVGVMWWFLFRTGPGLKIRATGEDALAAHVAGVNVARVRAVNLIIAAVLSSVGGASLSVGWVRSFIENITFGRGYIALAAVYCGRWNPLIVLATCLVFGAGEALAFRAQAGLVGINPYYLFMVPYALTILVIALAGKGRGPVDAGKPFIRR